MKTMRRSVVAGALVALAMSGTANSGAARQQAPAADARGGQIGCFRGKPLPACRSFWIFELQGSAPLVQTRRRVVNTFPDGPTLTQRATAFESSLEWNLGHMVNVSPSWAVGGVFTAGPDGRGAFRGVKARARRWLSPDVALELEGGLLAADVQGAGTPGHSGVTADVRLDIRDQGSFFVRWDGVPLREAIYPYGYYDSGGFQQALSAGVGLGSVPALIGSTVTGLAVLVLVISLIGYD